MNDFLNKCFGFNHMNLIGWIVAGASLLGVSGYFGFNAFVGARAQSTPPGPELYILGAIALLLLGIFSLLLQIYCALVVEQLNKQAKISSGEMLE